MEITGDLLARRVGMFLKGMKIGLPFIKKEGAAEEDIDGTEEAEAMLAPMEDRVDNRVAESVNTPLPLLSDEEDRETVEAADALLTPMGGVADNRVAEPVNTPLPLVGDEEEGEIVEAADALLTPMGDGVVNTGQAAVGGNVDNEIALEGIVDEENKGVSADVFESSASPEEAKAEQSGDGGKDAFMDGLFDQEEEEEESPVELLIASLPEITLEEVVDTADEVKKLMSEWQ